MIITTLTKLEQYKPMIPRLGALIQYLKEHDLSALPLGRNEVLGDCIFINCADADLAPVTERKLEVHRRYIDIHIPLSDSETIGWSPLEALGEPLAPFDKTADFALYPPQTQTTFQILPGQCCVCFPNDAHAPILGQGRLHKAVVKVLIQ